MNAESSVAALDVARKRYEDGDDEGALRFAQKAVRLDDANDQAKSFCTHLEKFGPGSAAAEAAKAVIDAPHFYAILGARRSALRHTSPDQAPPSPRLARRHRRHDSGRV